MDSRETPQGQSSWAGHHPDGSAIQDSGVGLGLPTREIHGRSQIKRVVALVAGSIACLLAVTLLAGGGWALGMDRVSRDSSGYLSIATTALHTKTYAIVSDVHGDGPTWLYGSTVLGTARLRATSQTADDLFIGIARTGDVTRYLGGSGYATIQHLTTGELTDHPGSAAPAAPARASFWAASREGTGQQTLLWKPRAGDWSVVLMNANAHAGVAIRGDLGATFPPLPWIAVGVLVAAAVLAAIGVWLLLRALRRDKRDTATQSSQFPGLSPTSGVHVGAHT